MSLRVAQTECVVCTEGSQQCTVCLEAYDVGDMVTTLPCSHYYHNTCIIQWLQQVTVAAFCHSNIFVNVTVSCSKVQALESRIKQNQAAKWYSVYSGQAPPPHHIRLTAFFPGQPG